MGCGNHDAFHHDDREWEINYSSDPMYLYRYLKRMMSVLFKESDNDSLIQTQWQSQAGDPGPVD